MRKTFLASIFTLLLAAFTYAGEMQFPVAPPPPPTTNAVQVTDGGMECGLTEIALILLNSVLSLP